MSLQGTSSPGALLAGGEPERGLGKLDAILADVRKSMQDASVGDLRAAMKLVPLEEKWEELYQAEAGYDWAQWVSKHFGAGAVRRFRNLSESLTVLRKYWRGTDLVTRFHQDVLIYIAGDCVPEEKRKECLTVIRAKCGELQLPILPKRTGIRIAREVCGKKSVAKGDSAERKLMIALWQSARGEIERRGGTVPDVPRALSWLQ